MPVHDWTRVEAGIFHDFHHAWIEEIKRALNAGLLPEEYYAMAEQRAPGIVSDVLTLKGSRNGAEPGAAEVDLATVASSHGGSLLLAEPKTRLLAVTDLEAYNRKQKIIAVRHVSGDDLVAVVEIVSPGNKASRHGLRSFVKKAVALVSQEIHLLVLDLHPPGPRDPHGIHAAIWEELSGQTPTDPPAKPLILTSYEATAAVRAFAEFVAVGDALPEMPLFLNWNGCVHVPLEATYQAAFAAVPRRWRSVLELPG